MAAFATLIDNFDDNTLDTALWPASHGAAEVGGRAQVTCDTNYNAYQSGRTWTLISSQVFVRMFPPAQASGTTLVLAEMGIGAGSGGTDVGLGINSLGTPSIGFHIRTAWSDPGYVSLAYDSTAHAWVRIREAAGTIYWDTSPDGATWTNRRTASTPGWMVTDAQELWLLSHRDDGTNNVAEWDNLNTIPSHPPITRRLNYGALLQL